MVPVHFGLAGCLSACCLEPIKCVKFYVYKIYLHFIGSVAFIDYEYAGWNYLAFDIADHFVEFAGLDSEPVLTCHVISDTSSSALFVFVPLPVTETSASDLRSTRCALRVTCAQCATCYVLRVRVGLNVPLQHSCYPSEAFQREWLRHYLQRRRALLLESSSAPDDRSSGNDTRGSMTALDVGPLDEQLERLLRHVQHFSVVRLPLICALVSLITFFVITSCVERSRLFL